MNEQIPAVLSITEGAKYLRVSRGVLERWIRQDLIAVTQYPGQRKRSLSKAALDAFIAKHTKGPAEVAEPEKVGHETGPIEKSQPAQTRAKLAQFNRANKQPKAEKLAWYEKFTAK